MKHVWKCDYCSRKEAISESKEVVLIHETKCNLNPNNKLCATCSHACGLFRDCCDLQPGVREHEVKTPCLLWEIQNNELPQEPTELSEAAYIPQLNRIPLPDPKQVDNILNNK